MPTTSKMKLKTIYIFVTIALAIACTSCRSTSEMVYLKDAPRDSTEKILQDYKAIVMPNDDLEIDIVSRSPESLYDFYRRIYANRKLLDSQLQEIRSTYTVAANGTIVVPLIDTLHVAGLTLDSIARRIETYLRDGEYIDDPQVTVIRTNFRVTVVGEVRRPGQINVEGERLTVLEAVAIAGDITNYGMRASVRVMRDIGGKQQVGTIDLTSRTMLDSPYYYLQQNDIVYIEPDARKKRVATRNPNIPSYISIGSSIASLISNIVMRTQRSGYLNSITP